MTEPEFEHRVFLSSNPMTYAPLGFKKPKGGQLNLWTMGFYAGTERSRVESKAREW